MTSYKATPLILCGVICALNVHTLPIRMPHINCQMCCPLSYTWKPGVTAHTMFFWRSSWRCRRKGWHHSCRQDQRREGSSGDPEARWHPWFRADVRSHSVCSPTLVFDRERDNSKHITRAGGKKSSKIVMGQAEGRKQTEALKLRYWVMRLCFFLDFA